ncbi:MAG TPA: MmoB/DmpM family protein [Candidatus Binatia bacterium]|jgi:toluene monooxygenase system protein D|nr:MmoB/DmpM family protein [Candidatus Binatia bacterium]
MGAASDDPRLVGPVLQVGDVAEAILEAIREDNPGREVITEEHSSYVRILCPEECVIRCSTVAAILGRPFGVTDIETIMSAFSGQIETRDDRIRFFLRRLPKERSVG